MSDLAAILMSTIVVVLVAEIVPMSYTTGPSKYKVAYTCAPLVNICIKIYYIIAYSIARGLDKLLGVHDTSHIKRWDFIAFINDKKKVNFIWSLELFTSIINNNFQSNICWISIYKCIKNHDTKKWCTCFVYEWWNYWINH